MVVLTATDIVGKKAVESDILAPLKLRISAMSVSSIIGIVMYLLDAGESGLAPWVLLAEHPMIWVAIFCRIFSEFLYVFSLRYVGMTIMEAISSLESIVIFSGLVFINLVSGQLAAIRDMLIPAKLVIIGVIIVFTALLPNIDSISNRKNGLMAKNSKEKRRMTIGVLVTLSAVIFGCGDSLFFDATLDSQRIGAIDIIMTVYFSLMIPLPFFCLALYKRSKVTNLPAGVFNRYSIFYAVFSVTQITLGLIAASIDAVRSEIMYIAYPVISILGARIVLKEKYSGRQSICIWIITVSAILFCMVDNLI